MNAGIGQPCARAGSLLFRAALIFVVVVWDAEPKKPRKFPEYCKSANLFSFPSRAAEIIDPCGNVKMTVDISKGTKF